MLTVFEKTSEGSTGQGQRILKLLLSQVGPSRAAHAPAEMVQSLDLDPPFYRLCPRNKCVTFTKAFCVKGRVKTQCLGAFTRAIMNAYRECPIAVTALYLAPVIPEWPTERIVIAPVLRLLFVYVCSHQIRTPKALECSDVAFKEYFFLHSLLLKKQGPFLERSGMAPGSSLFTT